MLYQLKTVKANPDKTIDIPDGCIPLNYFVDPINGFLDFVEHKEHGYETFIVMLVPVKS